MAETPYTRTAHFAWNIGEDAVIAHGAATPRTTDSCAWHNYAYDNRQREPVAIHTCSLQNHSEDKYHECPCGTKWYDSRSPLVQVNWGIVIDG